LFLVARERTVRARAARPRIRGISEAAVDRARYTIPHTAHFRQRVHARKRRSPLSGGYPPDARYYADSRGARETPSKNSRARARASDLRGGCDEEPQPRREDKYDFHG